MSRKFRGLNWHFGPHHSTYWWGGGIGWDAKDTWPLWYISWGGKRSQGCHLFSAKIRIGVRFYGPEIG